MKKTCFAVLRRSGLWCTLKNDQLAEVDVLQISKAYVSRICNIVITISVLLRSYRSVIT